MKQVVKSESWIKNEEHHPPTPCSPKNAYCVIVVTFNITVGIFSSPLCPVRGCGSECNKTPAAGRLEAEGVVVVVVVLN